MSTKLVMSFRSAEGGTVSYSLDDPLEDLTSAQVTGFMNELIDADVFDIKGGLREIKSAELITTVKKELA